jgi:hypothetical protein
MEFQILSEYKNNHIINKEKPMADTMYGANMDGNPRSEIIYAIKERITALSRGNDAPVQLNEVIICDTSNAHNEPGQFFEINNLFVDDSGCLCGDLVSRYGRRNGDVFFGKDIEDLDIGDLNTILDTLCRIARDSGREYTDLPVPSRRSGFSGYLFGKYAGIARTNRKNA